MKTKKKQLKKKLKKLQKIADKKQIAWQRYRLRYGPMSLSTHIFMSEPTKGFPVLVKSHTEKTVTLIVLQTGEEIAVGLGEYRQRRGGDFLLDPALEDVDKTTFDRHAEWFRNAYRAVGLSADTFGIAK